MKKCPSCKCEGNTTREVFKQRSFSRFPWIYYICRKCGVAHRAENTLQPKQRGIKQTLKIAREIVNRYKECSEQTTFRILVWGPGSKNENTRYVYQKRTQIRDLLTEMGMEAFFSEDFEVRDDAGRLLPFDLSEMLQVNHVDLVINIAASPGSLLEAQKISTRLLYRCLIWLPEEAKGGFAAAIIAFLDNVGLPPLYFDSADVKACVLTLAAQDWVEGLRINEIGLDVETKLIEETRIKRDRRTLQ